MLELLVIPACFLGAGLIGYRLGTPARVAGGLVAVGCCHLLAFLGARQALAAIGGAADLIHLATQWLFLGGFVAIVWLAAAYPNARPSRSLMGFAVGIGVAGPLLASISGPTPSIIDDGVELGPVMSLLPQTVASFAVAPLLGLPLMALIVFALRASRTTGRDRAAMRWPIIGATCLFLAVLAGTLAPPSADPYSTALFLMTAPLLPLALAFGPVEHRMNALNNALAQTHQRLSEFNRPSTSTGSLTQLTPRENAVLAALAQGASNPDIARQLHISLSAVEKHVTSIFRKLDIIDGPAVHRRVTAAVAYRNALEVDTPRRTSGGD